MTPRPLDSPDDDPELAVIRERHAGVVPEPMFDEPDRPQEEVRPDGRYL